MRNIPLFVLGENITYMGPPDMHPGVTKHQQGLSRHFTSTLDTLPVPTSFEHCVFPEDPFLALPKLQWRHRCWYQSNPVTNTEVQEQILSHNNSILE